MARAAAAGAAGQNVSVADVRSLPPFDLGCSEIAFNSWLDHPGGRIASIPARIRPGREHTAGWWRGSRALAGCVQTAAMVRPSPQPSAPDQKRSPLPAFTTLSPSPKAFSTNASKEALLCRHLAIHLEQMGRHYRIGLKVP